MSELARVCNIRRTTEYKYIRLLEKKNNISEQLILLRRYKHIAEVQKYIDDYGIEKYIEPFVGGANIIDKIHCKRRIGADKNKYLIALLKRVRDYAEVYSNSLISYKEAKAALELLEVDEKGFDRVDNKILEAIIDNFNGGPVGIETLSYFIGEELGTIEDVYEPYLLQEGFIIRNSWGTMYGIDGYYHLKYEDFNNSFYEIWTMV